MAEEQNLGKLMAIHSLLDMDASQQNRLSGLQSKYHKGRSPGISWLKTDISQLNRNLAGPLVNWNLPPNDNPYTKVFDAMGAGVSPQKVRSSIDTAQKATMNARKAAGLTGHHGSALKTMLPLLKKLFQQKRYGVITGLLTRLSERGYQFEDAQDALAYIDPGAHMTFTQKVIGNLGDLGITDVPTELKDVLEPWTAHATHVGGTKLKIGKTSLQMPSNLADLVDNVDQLTDLAEYYLQVQQVGLANSQTAHRFLGQVNTAGDVGKEVATLTKKLSSRTPDKVNMLTEAVQQINNAAASPTGKVWLRRAAMAGGMLSLLSWPMDLAAAPASEEHAKAREAEAAANPDDWWLQRQAQLDNTVAAFDKTSALMARDTLTPGKAQAELGSLGGTILSSAMDFGRWMQDWMPKPTYPLNPRQIEADKYKNGGYTAEP